MSLIKLKTKEEIKDFFKILAEESVKEAKKEVFSDDPMAPRLSRLEDEAKKAYDINEEEAPSISISRSAPEEDVSVDVELDDSIEPEEDSMSTSLESLPADIEDVSLDSVEKEINVLRGGRSLKDYEVSQGLKKYFDLLDQADTAEISKDEKIVEYSVRDDSVIEKLKVEDVVKNSAKVENNFFAVTKVIDGKSNNKPIEIRKTGSCFPSFSCSFFA